mmetsp:Transcript_27659/g.110757  ORF Transcript_27659/g.110757 Transcript_27659/m.110757 type:complete len:307 (-) Transcript_27659:186-1106(-)
MRHRAAPVDVRLGGDVGRAGSVVPRVRRYLRHARPDGVSRRRDRAVREVGVHEVRAVAGLLSGSREAAARRRDIFLLAQQSDGRGRDARAARSARRQSDGRRLDHRLRRRVRSLHQDARRAEIDLRDRRREERGHRGELVLQVRRVHGRAARLDRRARRSRVRRRLQGPRRLQPRHDDRLQRRLKCRAGGWVGLPRRGGFGRDRRPHRLLPRQRRHPPRPRRRPRPQVLRRRRLAVRLHGPQRQVLLGRLHADPPRGPGRHHPGRRLRARRRVLPPPLRLRLARQLRGSEGTHRQVEAHLPLNIAV